MNIPANSSLCSFHKQISLLKKSLAEFDEEEKQRKSLSEDANVWEFCGKREYFAVSKAHQFSFSIS
jgi:hypothetical protein